mmetsp:Transcript_96430/g.245044  ORF Transcript_96430/g.245044 Transcript_96430/m.245044 type:complete len:109 (-) Transcript_96430:363-689(-)
MGGCACSKAKTYEPQLPSSADPSTHLVPRSRSEGNFGRATTLLETPESKVAPKILKLRSAPALTRHGVAADVGLESPRDARPRSQKKRVTFGGQECRKFRVDLGGLEC